MMMSLVRAAVTYNKETLASERMVLYMEKLQ
jgi:hypothetical protein